MRVIISQRRVHNEKLFRVNSEFKMFKLYIDIR